MKRIVCLFFVFLVIAPMAWSQKREPGKVKTLVIDPGHGGVKPGAHGKQMYEKDLVLAVALKFGSLVEKHLPDVQVIYTRTTDVDITLAERARIANKAKADLFISVHANSHPTDKPTGVETFVMGLSQSKANLEVAKKENADILLESDYQQNSDYQGFDPNSPESYVMFAMYQNAYLSKSLDFANYIQKQYSHNLNSINRGVKQAELFVIYKTAMPAVLTEIGFISNPAEEAFMMSEVGQNKIAMSLYNAFATYKAREEGTEAKTITAFDATTSSTDKSSRAEKPTVADNSKTEPPKADADNQAQQIKEEEQRRAEAERQAAEEARLAQQQADSLDRLSQQNNTQSPTSQPSAQPSQPNPTVEQPQQNLTSTTGRVVFKVQFLRSDKLLKRGDKELKGLDNFTYYQDGNTYCYLWGETHSMNAAKGIQSDVRAKGFKDAFVVAFSDGQRITIQQALQLMQNE